MDDEASGSERQRVATEDLQHLISAWFDTTNAGPKKQKSSYEKIAEALQVRHHLPAFS